MFSFVRVICCIFVTVFFAHAAVIAVSGNTMAAKPVTLDDLCKMNKTQLQEIASEFDITLTSSKRSDILSELISKIPVPLDRPISVSKLVDTDPDTEILSEVKGQSKMPKPASRSSSQNLNEVFKDPPNQIDLEYEKIQLERERMAFERHQAEIEMERRRAESKLEMERLREEHRHELELKQLELQSQHHFEAPRVGQDNFRVVDAARMIPKFDPSDLENYLLSFERICAVNNWRKDHWSAILQTQLTGKALKVFAELSERDCSDYDVLKKALLVAYELCPEVYRKRFRSFTKLTHDTYADFAFKLHNVFKRWLEGVKAYDDIEALRQTMLLEQFFHILPDDLKLWLTDQKPKTVSEAAHLADQYVALHKSVSSVPMKQTASTAPLESSDSKVCAVFNRQFRKPQGFSRRQTFRNVTCFRCHKRGHIISQCRVQPKHTAVVNQEQSDTVPSVNSNNDVHSVTFPVAEVNTVHPLFEPYCSIGYIVHASGERTQITILRDTAALQSLIAKSCVFSEALIYTGENRWIRGISGNILEIPLIELWLQSEFCDKTVQVGLVDTLPDGVDFLLGNDLWCTFQSDSNDFDVSHEYDLVTTRSMTRNNVELDTALPDVSKLFVDSSNTDDDSVHDDDSTTLLPVTDENVDVSDNFGDIQLSSVVSRDDLISLQKSDNSLNKLFHLVEDEPYPSARSFLFMKNGLLMRRQISTNHNISYEQVVVPTCLRNKLLWLAHDIPAAGHLAERKTKFRLVSHFWWPKCGKHVHDYVGSCDVCQRLGKGGKPKQAPLIPLPVISEPFKKVAIDIVGPLPTTAAGNRFILTLIDLGSLYPEAIALPSHTAADVATALSEMFSRFGFPEVLLSDQGSDFMSQLMQVFLHDFQISQIRCSIFHPESNGTLERFHRTLKSMLKALVDNYDIEWDKSLHWSLFAFREVPVETVGFSPFELLFGRKVRGPLHLLI